MKKILLYFVCFCLVIVTSNLYGQNKNNGKKNSLSVGDTVPIFISTDIHGKEVNSKKMKGKVVLISISHFDQGGEYKHHRPTDLQKAINYHKAHKNKGLEVIYIASKRGVLFSFFTKSFVESRAKLSFAKRNGEWKVIIDWDNSLKKLFKMTDEPLLFVLDKRGIIQFKKNGHLIVDNALDKIIQKLLNE